MNSMRRISALLLVGLIAFGCRGSAASQTMMLSDDGDEGTVLNGQRDIGDETMLFPPEPAPFAIGTQVPAGMTLDTLRSDQAVVSGGDRPGPMPVEPSRR